MRRLGSALLLLCLLACVRQERGSSRALEGGNTPTAASLEGEPLELTLPRFPGGEPYSLSSDRGSVVLLDVWATWCEPCKDALPSYAQLAREYGPRGLKVYALSVDEDPRQVHAFLAENRVDLPILMDRSAEVAERLLHISGVPTTFLVDRQGRVRHVHQGFSERSILQYVSQIEALLAEAPL
jgi:thiol-disulfide isomerase/thioredoxin